MMDGGDDDRRHEVHDDAYRAGMWKAITMLREAAMGYEQTAADERKIHASEGARFAATLLRSWANGIEIEANPNG